jgi:hypothetical protein
MMGLENVKSGTADASSPGSSLRLRAMLSFIALVAAIILLPARIGSKGFMPPDDALRHAAKAVSGKSWDRILVLRDDLSTDMHHGWHSLLSFVHKQAGADNYALVALSVTFCFVVFAAFPLFFLKRPESWLLLLTFIIAFMPTYAHRIFLGRPFIIACAVQCFIYLNWRRFTAPATPYGWMAVLTAVMAVLSWLLPTSAPLFAILLVGFALARQWRALVRLTICIVAGSVIGYCMTGYPLRLAHDVAFVLFNAPDLNLQARFIVGETQPKGGEILFLFCLTVPLILRAVRKRWDRRVVDNPLFIIAAANIVFGHIAGRLWAEWGMTAALMWLVTEIDPVLEELNAWDSAKRLVVSAAAAACFFIVVSADVGGRWTYMVPRYAVNYAAAAPEERPWFPDSGGIMYNSTMTAFYQLFFDNPQAPWKYVLGFEAVLMPPGELKIYRDIQRDENSKEAYVPWVDKMRKADRMVVYTAGKTMSVIDRLEWHCMGRNTWFGRLPRTDTAANAAAPLSAAAAR